MTTHFLIVFYVTKITSYYPFFLTKEILPIGLTSRKETTTDFLPIKQGRLCSLISSLECCSKPVIDCSTSFYSRRYFSFIYMYYGAFYELVSRLVRLYKLLYKPWAKSIEGDFRPSTARRPLDQFSWNLKYITTSRTRPCMQKFRGLRRRGWSAQIASLTHESFCPFFSLLRHAHRSHFWTHPNAQYVIIHRFRQGSAFWGLERLNLKFGPLYPQKT